MKRIPLGGLMALAVGVSLLAGCRQTVEFRCKYKPGDRDKIRYTSVRTYKNWIEMEDKKPQGMSSRKTTETLVLNREIVSVEPDGSALMKVSIEQAEVQLDLDTPNEEKIQHYYRSGPAGLDTTWAAMPPMRDVEYTLKIAPNTKILDIQGLSGVREKYFSGDKESLVSELLSDSMIRRVHQRDFLQNAPARVQQGQTYEWTVEIPDSMVKAEAIRRTFTVDSIQSDKTGSIVTVRSISEPLMVRPEGFPPAPAPHDFGALLKETSDMQEFKYDGNDAFDTAKGCAVKEQINMYCYLMMLEETFFLGMEKYGKSPEDAAAPNTNAMLTEVTFESRYERLE